jgi:hypothetical protein
VPSHLLRCCASHPQVCLDDLDPDRHIAEDREALPDVVIVVAFVLGVTVQAARGAVLHAHTQVNKTDGARRVSVSVSVSATLCCEIPNLTARP